ncbi:MAG: M3 family metallopeptidase [Acidobacteriota bacterium]|nr:M3 family metallopeptidase [Acidobacteriota bacterium]
MSAPNPLLEIQFRIPFDRVRAEHVEPAIQNLLADARLKLEALADATEPRTFENTMLALERITENLDYAMSVVRHLESVTTYPELRAAFNAVEPEVSAFYTGISLHPGVWKQVQSYAAIAPGENLSHTRRRFLRKTVDSFRRHGADLDAAGKRRMAEIDVELSRLTTKFSENVLDSTNAFELILDDESKLAGLPATAIAAAKESAAAKGARGWRFTLQAPSYLPLMTYLDDREIRESMYRAYVTRAASGPFDNRENLAGILKLRDDKAKLLGFRDFADLVLDDRMAHSGDRALQFLEDLKQRTLASFQRENRELEHFAGFVIEPWDIGYFAEKQRAALYDFDEEALRPYFQSERVVEGMFDIVQRLFGIIVSERSGVPVWHPDVRYFTIHNAHGLMLGAFYSDWHPRESKRDGAWMDAFVTGVDLPERFEPHVGAVCGNLTPPVGDKPALLTHREVETIFHEFGHLLHHCLSRVEVKSLAGTSVAWDFVELPSQIMENWCWEREALDLFARHYETGDPIPDELFQKMRRAKNFRGANGQMRQIGFGLVDLALHTRYKPERDGDPVTYSRKLMQEFSPAPLPPENAMIAGFTHLFASPVGYGAGYYSYKWAEVLDADAFTRFREKGIFNREVGLEFLENILAKGDSVDPAELYRRFMGRDPDLNALLERAGLTAELR